MKYLITYQNILLYALTFCMVQCNAVIVNKGFYPQELSDFSTTGAPFGAGVMPYYEEKGEKYVLIGREVNSGSKHAWAFFSGGSEVNSSGKGSMEHPLESATREFFEEAALHKTLGWDQATVKEYIKKNTTEVIARYSRDVQRSRPLIMYVVKFEKKQIEKIVSTFKDIFNDPKLDDAFKEKDALVVVKYQDLIDAVLKKEQRIKLDKSLPQWFNKDKEDQIFIYSMPYNLLRARYAPTEKFTVSGKEFHYIHDNCTRVQQKNHIFLAQEPVTKIIKSKL